MVAGRGGHVVIGIQSSAQSYNFKIPSGEMFGFTVCVTQRQYDMKQML